MFPGTGWSLTCPFFAFLWQIIRFSLYMMLFGSCPSLLVSRRFISFVHLIASPYLCSNPTKKLHITDTSATIPYYYFLICPRRSLCSFWLTQLLISRGHCCILYCVSFSYPRASLKFENALVVLFHMRSNIGWKGRVEWYKASEWEIFQLCMGKRLQWSILILKFSGSSFLLRDSYKSEYIGISLK